MVVDCNTGQADQYLVDSCTQQLFETVAEAHRLALWTAQHDLAALEVVDVGMDQARIRGGLVAALCCRKVGVDMRVAAVVVGEVVVAVRWLALP